MTTHGRVGVAYAVTRERGWVIVLGRLGATAVAAIWRPARDAARADPLLLLREE